MWYTRCDKLTEDFYEMIIKTAKRDMPGFEKQDRPEKAKEIYHAIRRDKPNLPKEMAARIASRHGKPGKQHQGPPYEAPIKSEYTKSEQEADKTFEKKTTKSEREKILSKEREMEKEGSIHKVNRTIGNGKGRTINPQNASLDESAQILKSFNRLPTAEKDKILAKAMEIVNTPNESALKRGYAKQLLKLLSLASKGN